jgi:quinol monooxygenase YgiN
MFYERYKNRDAWAVTHASQPYVKTLIENLGEYLNGEFELAEYELLETLQK